MVDISAPLQNATTPPQEAAQNIDGAAFFGTSPDIFSQNKEELQPEINKMRQPAEATPIVAQTMNKSDQHASLLAATDATGQSDIAKMSTVEKMWRDGADQINGKTPIQKQINDIRGKELWDKDNYSQADDDKISVLKAQLGSFPDYKLGYWESIPGEVASSLVSMGSSLADHARFIMASGGSGALLGAGVGLAGGPLAEATAPIGAVAGFGIGVSNAALISIGLDAAKSQTESIYGELSDLQNSDGTPMNVDYTTKKYLATGVGLATAAIQMAVGKAVTKTIPILGNMINPELPEIKAVMQSILKEPANSALKNALFEIGKSSAAGVTGAASQKSLEVLARQFAATKDANGDYLAAIVHAAPEIVKAGLVGGLTTAGITAAGAIAGGHGIPTSQETGSMKINGGETPIEELPKTDITPRFNIKSESEPSSAKLTTTDQAVQTASFGENLKKLSDLSKTTEMAKHSPDQLFQLNKTMAEEANMKPTYIDPEDLEDLSKKSDKNRFIISNLIDPSGILRSNAPVQLPPATVIKLIDKLPDALGKLKLDPEGPTVDQGKQHLDDISKANKKQQEIKQQLDTKDLTPEKKKALQEALDEATQVTTPKPIDVHGEADYLDQSGLEKAMNQIVPKAEQAKYLEAQRDSKQQVVNNINDTAKHEMDRVRDVVHENAMDTQAEIEHQKLVNDLNLAAVDEFKAQPDLRIDPDKLDKTQKLRYLKDPQLKKHQVFQKGGLHPDEAARMMGVNGGENLLKILKATPSREDIIAREVAKREQGIREESNASVDLNHTAISKAYEARLANALKTLKYIKEHNWPAMKSGIKRIALSPPTIPEITAYAKNMIDNMKVSELNANRFKVGERRSERIAVDNILKNHPQEAFEAQQMVAKNIALVKETQIAIGKINKLIKLAKKFSKPSVIAELEAAGKNYVDAANNILDNFSLNPSKKGLAKQKAFEKYVKEQTESGGVIETIPESFKDLRAALPDLTVAQASAISNVLENILFNARRKNKLFKTFVTEPIEKAAQENFEQQVQEAEQIAKEHPLYDESKTIVKSVPKIGTEKAGQMLADIENVNRRAQFLLSDMDQYRNADWYRKNIYGRIRDAQIAERETARQIRNHLRKTVDKFGKKDFKKMGSTFVKIPEFADSAALNNGHLTKAELFSLELNFGNEGNLKVMDEYGIDRKIIRDVLDRELEEKHTILAQEWRDVFKSFEPEIKALQKRTQGTDVEFVQPLPYVARGKQVEGGYWPIHRALDESAVKSEKLVGTAKVNEMRQGLEAQAQTAQGHLETRVGGKGVLDLDLNRFGYSLAQVIHDIHMREAIADTGKLLADDRVRKGIVGVLGTEGYDNITDMVIRSSNSAKNKSYNKVDKVALKVLGGIKNNMVINMIAGKFSSAMMAATALPSAIRRMGKDGGKNAPLHMAAIIKVLTSNVADAPTLIKLAEEIHPSIANISEGFESDARHAFDEFVPVKKGKIGKALTPFTSTRDFVNMIGMTSVGSLHKLNKVLVALTAYRQAISGDAGKGVRVLNHDEAVNYARDIVEDTQTAAAPRNISPLQANKWTNFTLPFYNDRNIMYNNIIAEGRQYKIQMARASNEQAKGNYLKAKKMQAAGVGGLMAGTMSLIMLKSLATKIIRGEPQPFDSDHLNDPEEFANSFFGLIPDEIFGDMPYISDLWYALGKEGKQKKSVDVPIMQTANDLVNTASALKHMLDFSNGSEITPAEAKASLNTFGLLAGGLPTHAFYDYFMGPNSVDLPSVVEGGGALLQLVSSITNFQNKVEEKNTPVLPEWLNHLDDIKQQAEIVKRVVHRPNITISHAAIKVATAPANEKDEKLGIPPHWYQVSAEAESMSGKHLKNPSSGAIGIWMDIPSTWNGVVDKHPEANLDRMPKEGKVMPLDQQRKVQELTTEDDARALKKAGLKVSYVNLYIAHSLGRKDNLAIKVIDSLGSKKMLSVHGITEDIIDNNPAWFNKNDPYSTTVHQYKYNIEKFLRIAAKRLTKQQNK